jgi:hypothetical protein
MEDIYRHKIRVRDVIALIQFIGDRCGMDIEVFNKSSS